jgi:hypothetical protein
VRPLTELSNYGVERRRHEPYAARCVEAAWPSIKWKRRVVTNAEVLERFKRALADTTAAVERHRDPKDGDVDTAKFDTTSPEFVEAARAMVDSGLGREMGELLIAAIDAGSGDKSLSGYLLWVSHRAKDPQRARLRPSVERLVLDPRDGSGRWSDVAVDQGGRPIASAHETIQSRWLGAGMLVIDQDGDSKGDQLAGDVFVEKGGFRLAVTNRRLIVAFNSAKTKYWGRIAEDGTGDGSKAVLAVSWPLPEIGRVNVTIKKKRFGRSEATGCNIIAANPFAYMNFVAASQADDTWTGSVYTALSSWAPLGEAIAIPAAKACLDVGCGNQANLRQVVAGSWNEGVFQGSDVMSAELAGLSTS